MQAGQQHNWVIFFFFFVVVGCRVRSPQWRVQQLSRNSAVVVSTGGVGPSSVSDAMLCASVCVSTIMCACQAV